MAPFKRKATEPPMLASTPTKRPRPDFSDPTRYKDSTLEIENGIVLRTYYPPEMTNERANMYASGQLERPIETLEKALAGTRSARECVPVGGAVLHWFKNDLRLKDNKALSMASKLAKKQNVPLICMYLVSPQDYVAHLTASVRVDFILRSLEVLKRDLEVLDIPLYMETVEKRRNVSKRIFELCQEWQVKHMFCNMEYEVDELRREAKLVREGVERSLAVEVVHDTCVVEPGKLKSNAGGQISVYSPWHRKWCAYLNEHPKELDEWEMPGKNPDCARQTFAKLFDCKVPEAPEGKRLSEEEKERFRGLWPAGEDGAMDRLERFILEKIKEYHNTRNIPSGNGTSSLSAHLASGTLAARTLIRCARDAAPSKKLTDDRKQGHSMWMGEVAWRDFYKHILCHNPYVCMNKPFKPEYSNIEWEYDTEQFKAWTEGRTGFPLVDAAMRQARHTGYMHNRCRMVVASFLAKDLMIDWRMGERWFMENLIDGDFASNNGGWGFSASCGADPQPYFRIFNPLLQSEKFDGSGEYIRRWVPELAEVGGKAIHDPYGRGAEAIARKNGYPKPIVVHAAAREKALARYKAGIGRSTA